MFILVPVMALDAWITGLLAGFSHAGTAVTVTLFVTCAVLAMRCKGRCCEDEIFRSHVI